MASERRLGDRCRFPAMNDRQGRGEAGSTGIGSPHCGVQPGGVAASEIESLHLLQHRDRQKSRPSPSPYLPVSWAFSSLSAVNRFARTIRNPVYDVSRSNACEPIHARNVDLPGISFFERRERKRNVISRSWSLLS
jgi:hypothetical protein